jgi:hypothetical protein
VTDLRYELRHPKESFHNTSITMDCDQCVVATLHGKPMFTKVLILTDARWVESRAKCPKLVIFLMFFLVALNSIHCEIVLGLEKNCFTIP